jgi:D-serine deaminase-like pyridoxal phosphate-dependent protein
MTTITRTLEDLDTPVLLLDAERLRHNARTMLDRCGELGVGLRPHMKTLKSIDAARIAVDPSHGGIAAATLNEAEYFAGHGIEDIQYAVCIPPSKLARAADILSRAPRFSMFLDSVETAEAVTSHAQAQDVPFRVWIEIDSGEHRTGTDPHGPELIRIAQALRAPVILEGVATHGGHSYMATGAAEIARTAEDERRAVVDAAERLRAAGFQVPGVSAGSTPTAMHLTTATGLTELRAGVYMAGDLFQTALGALPSDSWAVTVLATVISRNPATRQVVVDAGGLALSKDRGTSRFAGADYGYGLVLDIHGTPRYGRLCVSNVYQEHGEIHDVPAEVFPSLTIGSLVRIVPNHVCMTAAMYDRFVVADEAGQVLDEWPRTNGWS